MSIVYKSEREVEHIRDAGKIVAAVLDEIGRLVAPGVTTAELRDCADRTIRERGGEPVFQTEAGFPASICTSVNEEVVHGLPGPRELVEGDMVSVDVGVRSGGYIGDAARTFAVGEVDAGAARLLTVARECLERAIGTARAGVDLSEVSRAIQSHAEGNGFSVVRDFVGHGVGEKLHEPPQVPNFVGRGGASKGTILRSGVVIAIEPMVNAGTWRVRKLRDGWTIATRDGERSAHFEHTVVVSEDGAEVLTLP
ncbi:MAG: type I methionyl aminopeptidase [Planctomycetota bacterium]